MTLDQPMGMKIASLNVYAPANASSLPVLVWIHGGGYGAGNGREDLSPIINANHNNFVGVAIQYRVRISKASGSYWYSLSQAHSAFSHLTKSIEKGVVNAGLLNQHFALQWVQSYIG